MRDIAFLVSSDILPGREGAREDVHEFELEFGAIEPPCRAAGFALHPVVWDEGVDPAAWDGLVIGPTWDYTRKRDAYLDALDRFAAARPLLNPPHVVRWNIEKTYLRDLAAAGAPTVPTIWAERADAAEIERAFAAFACDEVVVKPVVGASAWRQARVRRGDPAPAADAMPPAEAMIQPFLPSIGEAGELTLMFFGGVFSHALIKRPAKGDYRVQSIYGGVEERCDASAEELELGRRALDAACAICAVDSLLYARVDIVRGLDGRPALMELELIEPYYYPEQGPRTGALFAEALTRLLG
ncbi:hypothetical protein DDZ18_01645 [Marinicauda salina]|uniref:Transporter n=1 Tax=Marinicauda salina TaxID=2135793 RepID=A0A2U2BWD7_9PROT|nr:hypothetical protein [Marinicauda salina]PWE18336.1 hypothetical protein DDZ18_01645 [Marinicauda salina]